MADTTALKGVREQQSKKKPTIFTGAKIPDSPGFMDIDRVLPVTFYSFAWLPDYFPTKSRDRLSILQKHTEYHCKGFSDSPFLAPEESSKA